MNDVVKNLVLWVVIAVVLLSVFHSFGDRSSSAQNLIYSDFLSQVKQGQVREVTIEGQNITGKLVSGAPFSTFSPETNNSALIGDLERANVANAKIARSNFPSPLPAWPNRFQFNLEYEPKGPAK